MGERRRRIAISVGDPAGVGPELIVSALADAELCGLADYVVTGAIDTVLEIARSQGLTLVADLRPIEGGETIEPGTVSAAAGRAAVASVAAAIGVVTAGEADALVTAPISKHGLQLAGFDYPGQTELLSALCKVDEVRVMLVAGKLRVAHVTTHVPLSKAVHLVTRKRVTRTIELAHNAARDLGLSAPRLGVAGVNPHAGEGGVLGSEEDREIRPAVDEAAARGIDVRGPISADTLFRAEYRRDFDVVVAMYHDQGHIPVKMLAAEDAVTLTLGLPFLRTSPDHGAAHAIARTGRVRPDSFKAAVRLAASALPASAS